MAIEQAVRMLSGRWRQIATSSINFRIFSALVTVGGIVFLVKIVSAVKEVIVAASFGTGDVLDAFLIAFLLPTYFMNIVAGSFNAAFIPTYIEVQEREGRMAAQRLFSGIMICSTGLLVLLAALLGLAGSYLLPLLAFKFDSDKLALSLRLFYILLPCLVIDGVVSLWGAVLNARERFALMSLASIAIPIASVAMLYMIGGTWGIYALAAGVLLGFIAELCLLGIGLRRHDISLWPQWSGISPAMRQVIGQYLPMVAGAALLSSTPLIDQIMSATLDSGSVAALNYGNKIVSLVLGVGTMALGTAVLPYFSRMVATTDWGAVRYSLRTYRRLILWLSIPFTLLVFTFSRPLVALLFQRGKFTEADTLVVSQVQAMYILQVPFHTLGILYVRLISSLQANHILMWGTLISFILNFALDYALMQVFGVAGIALSTTIVYVVSCGFLAAMLRLKLKQVAG